MNIAYMTVGGYPDQVPKAYLIPPSAFESEEAFPRFANIAPALGLDTVNNSGGAIADDEASITINGEVRSSNGRRTRWINGEVNWEGNAPSAPVPVGDTFNPATGERESLLRDGRIQIKRGTPAR